MEAAGIPHMQAGGTPPQPSQMSAQTLARMQALQALSRSPQIKDATTANPVEFFRHNPRNKFGAKDRLETISSAVDRGTMEDFIRAMRAGEKYGVPQLPPEYLASMLMKENRSDFGYNAYNENNPKARMIAEMLIKEGFDPTQAGFGAAIYDKMQTANRLKIPFAMAWNGTGVNKQGQTGQQYAQGISSGFEAVMHPRNAPMLNIIKEAYNYQPLQQQQEAPVNNYIPTDVLGNPVPQYNAGGSTTPFYDMSKLVIQKHLSGK